MVTDRGRVLELFHCADNLFAQFPCKLAASIFNFSALVYLEEMQLALLVFFVLVMVVSMSMSIIVSLSAFVEAVVVLVNMEMVMDQMQKP